jgi:adenosylmethionine-8-amino-7-oxononanoate aminotransferase
VPGSYLHAFTKPTRNEFISLVRGEGARVYDARGREYIDAMASLWYCAVGHGRREIADAVARQMTTLESYSNFDPFSTDVTDRLADRIVLLAPLADARVFFCGSGSEAVDSAMKLVRQAHVLAGRAQRTVILSRMRGYHGTNYGGTSAQGLPLNRAGWGPLVGDVEQVAADDIEALSVAMSKHGERLAAVLIEPVQGAGGVYPPPPGYLRSVRELCDKHGAYLIFDEVITAFGRLGTWFGAQAFDVVPDVLCFAKAVTSGYVPLGGVLVNGRVRAPLESDPSFILRHGYTYSGHASACAAAIANLDILEREGLLARALRIGARLESGLVALRNDGLIAEVRGTGGMWAAGVLPGHDAQKIRDIALDNGVIVRGIGAETNAFCPPLVITDDELSRVLDVYADAVMHAAH